MSKFNGLNSCNALPNSKSEDGILCHANATTMMLSNSSCINWNQYYTECRAGDKNPFQGAISFDNIGLAFIAIFQVNNSVQFLK